MPFYANYFALDNLKKNQTSPLYNTAQTLKLLSLSRARGRQAGASCARAASSSPRAARATHARRYK